MRELHDLYPLRSHPRYEPICFLGAGSCGKVYKARIRTQDEEGDQVVVAIKLLGLGPRSIDKHVENELILHYKCFHPHIVTLKDVTTFPENLALVMEYVPGGDMINYLRRRDRLKESEARWIFQQVVSAVDYLHRSGIAQRDIKLDNILVTNPEARLPHIKLADFGFSRTQSTSLCKTEAGTCAYMAPEVYRGGRICDAYCGQKADMWSCGVILYVLLCHKYPFEVKKTNSMRFEARDRQRVMRAEFSFPTQCVGNADARELVRSLIAADPDRRLTTAQCLRHPWVKQDLPNVEAMNSEYLERSKCRLDERTRQSIVDLVARARGDAPPERNFLRQILRWPSQ